MFLVIRPLIKFKNPFRAGKLASPLREVCSHSRLISLFCFIMSNWFSFFARSWLARCSAFLYRVFRWRYLHCGEPSAPTACGSFKSVRDFFVQQYDSATRISAFGFMCPPSPARALTCVPLVLSEQLVVQALLPNNAGSALFHAFILANAIMSFGTPRFLSAILDISCKIVTCLPLSRVGYSRLRCVASHLLLHRRAARQIRNSGAHARTRLK